jgi:hypothetical protein
MGQATVDDEQNDGIDPVYYRRRRVSSQIPELVNT